jgi:hypothetical protein
MATAEYVTVLNLWVCALSRFFQSNIYFLSVCRSLCSSAVSEIPRLPLWRCVFSQHIFSDQFEFTKHERAFCTQIGQNKKNRVRPIWVLKALACWVCPPTQFLLRTKKGENIYHDSSRKHLQYVFFRANKK